MATTYNQIYLQTVFAVKYRNAVLDKSWRPKLQRVIGNLINETGCKTIIVNGAKAKLTKYINDHSLTKERFEWQEGYGVFSYRQRDIDMIYKYIQYQEEHHSKQTFGDEYLDLLKEFEIDYAEQYIFQELI
ncbi:MAG: transposase [Bacteroidota bacterium]|nr:transposase [Bacteroidota bacterium]